MHPILIPNRINDIHTYGAMVALGLLAGYFWMQYSAGKLGEDANKIADLALWVLISGFVGARLLYIILKFDEKYRYDPAGIFKIWEGGLVLYGGVIASLIVGYFLVKKKGMNFLRTADIAMPSVMLGIFFGRWGCLAAGCCYGKVAYGLPWAIRFPRIEGSMIPADLIGKPLHPTQIYSSLNALVLFLVLTFVLKKRRFEGQVFYLSLILYSVTRSVIECFRGDNVERGYLGPLSTSQWISLAIVVFAVWRYISSSRRERRTAAAGSAGLSRDQTRGDR